MKVGDVDKICMRDYIVGLGWALGSLCALVFVLCFDYLPIAIQIPHGEGFGLGQFAVALILFLSLISAIAYISDTYKYQKYLGA